MPIQYATNPEIERDEVRLGVMITQPDGREGMAVLQKAERGDAGSIFVFIGAVIHWARKLAEMGVSAILMYHPDDYAADGPDIPHGFEVDDEQ